MSNYYEPLSSPEPYRVCPEGHESEHRQEAEYCPYCGQITEVKQRQVSIRESNASEPKDSEEQRLEASIEQEKANDSLLDQKLNLVVSEIQRLQKLFTDRLRYDEAKEKAIETLANELAESTANHEFSLKKSFINMLISIYDQLLAAEKSFEAGTEARKRISAIRQDLLDKLYMEDIEPIKAEGDNLFDNRLQKAIGKAITSEISEDRKIQKITQEGFIQGKRVIRPQSVIVFRYSEQST